MLKVVNGGAPKTTKLILGFDAGCGTCADLAAGVQGKVGDKLEVQNLNDPQLMAWREEALGKDAKWTPTLFEVEGEKVLKAWAGWRMGYALSRKLGASSTWQVMQALGEVGGAPKVEESAIVEKLPEKAAEAVSGVSRSQFLKGVGGAALAMSVLSGSMLASPANAATRGPLDSLRHRKIIGAERMSLAKTVAMRPDVKNLVGTQLSTTTRVRNASPTVVKHWLRNGNVVLMVTYVLPKNRILVYRGLRNKPPREAKRLAQLWQVTRERKKMTLIKVSEGGRLWRNPNPPNIRAQESGVVPLALCPPVGGGGGSSSPPRTTPRGYENVCAGTNKDPDGDGYYRIPFCRERSYGCIAAFCSPAAATCIAAIPATATVVLIAKAYALCGTGAGSCLYVVENTCCTDKSTALRPCLVENPEGPLGNAM